ncbi:cell cycle control protein 50A-like isoform 2-T3 [Aphomia sociella]
MYNFTSDGNGDISCAVYEETYHTNDCICLIYVHITTDLHGDIPPIIYYELETYDQTSNQTYHQSKDENQLSGNLSQTPAAQCEPYRYFNGTPIFPCGAIANSIFNDTFIIKVKGNRDAIPTVDYGMIKEEDKVGFRNPPGDLRLALKNFTKPPSWKLNAWELDKTNPDNNGIQNEKFIGWMKTNWKRKPYSRINDTMLAKGNYMIRIDYYYPPSLYNGTRKLIISTYHVEYNMTKHNAGIALLTIGVIMALISAIFYYYLYKKEPK